MNSVQESKQELEAAIRYAENAISSANKTIESMEFRQEMAKKQSSEQTGREQALQAQVKLLEERIAEMQSDMVGDAATIKQLNDTVQFHIDREAGFLDQIKDLERELKRQQDLGQGYYDNMMTFKAELEKLRKEKEASSGPCGCQAYRDLEEKATMPVIPKAVAIAIFREGVQHGVEAACTELDNAAEISIEENEYCGDFEVSFSKYIDLSDHVDTDWMRGKCGDYSEESVIDALGNLCAAKEFECRIHGVDDHQPFEPEHRFETNEQGDDSKSA